MRATAWKSLELSTIRFQKIVVKSPKIMLLSFVQAWSWCTGFTDDVFAYPGDTMDPLVRCLLPGAERPEHCSKRRMAYTIYSTFPSVFGEVIHILLSVLIWRGSSPRARIAF